MKNYYIRGNKEKADKIRAAFEKLGYDTSRHLFNAESVLYFTLDGEIRATTCNCTPVIIKTHPDYKELELPVEPKFKVGDWVVSPNGSQYLIAYIDKEDNRYLFEINEYIGEPMHSKIYKLLIVNIIFGQSQTPKMVMCSPQTALYVYSRSWIKMATTSFLLASIR